jgi:hypothetical protein
MADDQEIFEAWAPRTARWTPWAKRILFRWLDRVQPDALVIPSWVRPELFATPTPGTDYRASARVSPSVAAVVDLPGAESVVTGLALSRLGFRPVPLYTARAEFRSLIPMGEVVRALVGGADELRACSLAPDAPPAFLLDSRRRGVSSQLLENGMFDNRAMTGPDDLPAAERLRQEGITSAVVVQRARWIPEDDIHDVLAKWQASGIPPVATKCGGT